MENYENREWINAGGAAEIFRAYDRIGNKVVVLKQVKLNSEMDLLKNELREPSILYELQHPNIVKMERVFVHEGSLWLVLESLNMDLAEDIRKRIQEYSPGDVKDYLRQIVSAVSHCHSVGILHRDLKPANILLDLSPSVIKLADFDMARAFVAPNIQLTPEVVTLNYRAPEILLGATVYTGAVDMWSIGCIFAEMVKKKKLFPGDTPDQVLGSIFSILGTPTEQTWPGVSDLPGFQVGQFIFQAKDLAQVVPLTDARGIETDAQGIDLLTKLLCLNPNERITAPEALQHPYLHQQEG